MTETTETETSSNLPVAAAGQHISTRLPPLPTRIWHEAGNVGSWRLPAPCLPHLPAMLAAARFDLEPAGPEAINSAVRDVLSGLPSKKQGDGDAKSALLAYRIGLQELPLDVLRLACKRAIKTCEWRPPPATLLKLVDEEMAALRRRLTRLQHATDRPPMPERIISEAEREAVIAGFEALKADLDQRNRAAEAAQQAQRTTGAANSAGASAKAVVEASLAAAKQKQQSEGQGK